MFSRPSSPVAALGKRGSRPGLCRRAASELYACPNPHAQHHTIIVIRCPELYAGRLVQRTAVPPFQYIRQGFDLPFHRDKRKRRTRLNAPPSVFFYSLVSESTGLMVDGLDHWNPGSSNPPAESQRPRNCILRQGITGPCSNPVAAPVGCNSCDQAYLAVGIEVGSHE